MPKRLVGPDWADAVFTSELGFLLHFPIFLKYGTQQRPAGALELFIFFARCGIHTIALPLLVWDARQDLWSWQTLNSALHGTHSRTAWLLLLVSLGLYLLSYAIHKFKQPSKTVHAVQPVLYGTAHVSVLNFLLDLPGRNVPTARRTHTLLVLVNLVAGSVLFVTYATATPLQKAWGCYQPSLIRSLRDYNRGMCPGDPTSTANICTERPYTNCEEMFEVDVFGVVKHYAMQALTLGLIVYVFSISSKLSFYKLQILAS